VADDDTGTPIIPGYSGLTLISRGSTAKVYRATQDRLNRPVAVKVLRVDDELTTAAQVRQELETTVALSQMPHIVSIIDTGTTDAGRPYIVMEYCEDGSYGHILAKTGPLPVHEVVDVGIKVAEALQAAHAVGIIHRDVKPHNVLRSKYGPALTDFGIARATGDLSGTITLNKLTPQHASPEALRREAQGPASDVYSLASTMWNLLLGYPPFANPGDNSPDPFEYRDRVLRDPLPPMPRADVPPFIQDEISRAMAKAPNERHRSAADFADALRRAWSRGTGEVWAPPAGYQPLTGGPETARTPSGMTGHGNSTGFGGPDTEFNAPPELHAPPEAPVSTGAPQPPAPAPPFSTPPFSTPPFSGPPAAAAPPYAPPPDALAGGTPVSLAPPTDAPAHQYQQAYQAPAAPYPPAPAPPGPPDLDGGEPHRRISIWPFVAAAVAGVLIGLGVLVGLRFTGNSGKPEAHGTPTPTVAASEDPSITPTGVTLTDHQTWVELSWRDHSDGKALFFVVGGPVGTTPGQLSQPARSTSRRIDGLRTDVDYCFNVMAMLSVDQVSPSSRVCTTRGTPSPGPTA
jgi:eukaryotic-like serine/threonine-protein kinase